MKCTWEEAIVIYKEIVEEVNIEKQRAVIGKGPYQLAAAYEHLDVNSLAVMRFDPHTWPKFQLPVTSYLYFRPANRHCR